MFSLYDEEEFNLYEIENQNMNTSLELFELVKQNAEEYCNYIKKYKECTSVYFDKLSKLTFNIKKDNILNKNINISSIFSIFNKIPELIKLQINGIKKFNESLDLTMKPLENVLKNEINSLEEPKKLFEENKKKYQRNILKHRKLMDTIETSEKKIIKYYLAKKKQKDYNEEKTNMMASLVESKIIEKDFLESTNNGINYHFLFQEDSLKNIEEIKSHIRMILENLNSCVLFFLYIFNDCYSPCINFITEQNKIIKTETIDTKSLINENMFLKTFTLEEIPSDKYTIKIFNKPGIDKLSYSIDLTNQNPSRNSNFLNLINFFLKDNDEINEEEVLTTLNKIDLLGIAKKMYHNLKMVNRDNYDIQSEEEKINVKKYSDKLLLMRKYKNSKKKNEKITSEEKKSLFELVQKKENGEIFLTRLNKIRSYGNFEYKKKIFDDILKIFLIILNVIENKQDYFLFQFSIILSQTFYYLENGEKQYLYKFIKNHKVFHSEEMWKNTIESIIKEKSDKFDEFEYKINNEKENFEEKKKQKIIEIAFAQIIAVVHNMIDFDFDLDKTEKMMVVLMDKYNLNEMQKGLVMEMIENKKKEIKEIKEKEEKK